MSLERARPRPAQAAFFLTVVMGGLLLLAAFPRLSFPLASAYILTLVLRPICDWLMDLSWQKRGMVGLGLALLLVALVVPLITLTSTLGGELERLSQNLPMLEGLLRAKFEQFKFFLWTHFKFQLAGEPISWLASRIGSEGIILNLPKAMGNMLEWLLLTPVFTWFLMTQSRHVKHRLLQLVPNLWFERVYMLLHQFDARFGGYILAKSIEATILGVLLFAGLLLIGFPYAFLLALIGGITNIIPYVGPLLGWGVALIVAVLQPAASDSLLAMTVVYLVANFIDMALVFPLLVSKIVNLHPLVVISSVIIGSEVGGLVGMIISVPVATFCKLLLSDVHKSLYAENS